MAPPEGIEPCTVHPTLRKRFRRPLSGTGGTALAHSGGFEPPFGGIGIHCLIRLATSAMITITRHTHFYCPIS